MSDQRPPGRELHIVGAGPAGLAAAITVARTGVRPVVHELRADVGVRFQGDLQGLENWSTEGDVLHELASLGIQPTFDHIPICEQVCYDPQGREYILRAARPLFYLVRRGPEEGAFDQALKQQALSAGAELRFHDPVQHLPDGGIMARGPQTVDAIAVGYHFKTDVPDGTYGALSNRLAPGGYAYLLISGGRATLAACLFRDFHNARAYLQRTLEFFLEKVQFNMKAPRHFAGYGNMVLKSPANQKGPLLVGEAAGFQDALWGFGIRYALISGHLAAQALVTRLPASYRHLWEKRLGGFYRTSIVNRYLYDKFGDRGYHRLIRGLSRARCARAALRRYYAPSLWKDMLFPLARTAMASRS